VLGSSNSTAICRQWVPTLTVKGRPIRSHSPNGGPRLDVRKLGIMAAGYRVSADSDDLVPGRRSTRPESQLLGCRAHLSLATQIVTSCTNPSPAPRADHSHRHRVIVGPVAHQRQRRYPGWCAFRRPRTALPAGAVHLFVFLNHTQRSQDRCELRSSRTDTRTRFRLCCFGKRNAKRERQPKLERSGPRLRSY